MPNIINNHTGIPFAQVTMQDAVNQFKSDIEAAITTGGEAAKKSLINSQKPIKLIHNAIKTELISSHIHPSLINPHASHIARLITPPKKAYKKPYKLKHSEVSLAGYLKTKNQDISIIPNNLNLVPENLGFPTMLNAYTDIFGHAFTESIISINVRSQLSSTDKNFDTLYERTFAEPLNLHRRCPRMVLGDVYLIILKEYDSDAAKLNNVQFKAAENIEKYIAAFQAINLRADENDEYWKYERCCLLVVDFDRPSPKIYNTTAELIQDGFLPHGSTISMTGLDYQNFVTDILSIYTTRFPANTFI
jgi:hypothetical protein